jgi:hypothetical protein
MRSAACPAAERNRVIYRIQGDITRRTPRLDEIPLLLRATYNEAVEQLRHTAPGLALPPLQCALEALDTLLVTVCPQCQTPLACTSLDVIRERAPLEHIPLGRLPVPATAERPAPRPATRTSRPEAPLLFPEEGQR